jgi:hypothetical protein
MQITFTTIAQGISSGYRKFDQLIIDTPEQWEHLWEEHTSDLIPPLKTPSINFARNLIIAVFSGEKPTSGYRVEIISVETKDIADCDRPHLIVRVHQGLPASVTQDVITHPHHIIQIPQISMPQVFFEEA